MGVIVGLYLVVRAVAEFFVVDFGDPATRAAWEVVRTHHVDLVETTIG